MYNLGVKFVMRYENSLINYVQLLTIPFGIMKWSCMYHNWMANKGVLVGTVGFILASIILFFIILLFLSIFLKSWDQDRRTTYHSKRFSLAGIGTIISLIIWFQIYDTFCCTNPNICCVK